VFVPDWLPTDRYFALVHVGNFFQLMESLSPFLDPAEPTKCLLMPSAAATRFATGRHLKDLDIGAYGYAVMKFPINGFPILFWPTAVFVAEHILGDRSTMLKMGIRIIEDIGSELHSFFPFGEQLLAFTSLQASFERT
jgi:hypothetical protein